MNSHHGQSDPPERAGAGLTKGSLSLWETKVLLNWLFLWEKPVEKKAFSCVQSYPLKAALFSRAQRGGETHKLLLRGTEQSCHFSTAEQNTVPDMNCMQECFI